MITKTFTKTHLNKIVFSNILRVFIIVFYFLHEVLISLHESSLRADEIKDVADDERIEPLIKCKI